MLIAVVFTAFSALLSAQQTGEIVGTVTDKTSAVLPHAKVTMTNTQSKDIRTTTSNAEGFFSFSGVVSGDYSVKVESKGFRTVEDTNIHISPGDRRNLNVMLTIAAENMSITVVADQSTVAVDSGDLSATVDAGDIQKLALTGRDVTELIKILPGFNQFTNLGGMKNQANYDSSIAGIHSAVGNGISAVGIPNRAGGADLTADGAHVIDPGCNCNSTQTVNSDMTAEVKVTSSAYGADQQTGPVVIAAVGKAGTSSYHGGAYMHYRSGDLNSTDWEVKNLGQTKADEHYKYPGAQISGPVPFTHKKLLVFAGYEYYDQQYPESTSSGLVKANVPTLSNRSGLFDPTLTDNDAQCKAMSTGTSGWDTKTQTYHDSYRCQTFTDIATWVSASGTTAAGSQVVPVTNEDISAYIGSGAKALLNEIPKPNYTPSQAKDFNYVKPLSNTTNGYMFHTRVDYNFSDTLKLYVSYNQQHDTTGLPVMRWWMYPGAVDFPGDISSVDNSKALSGNLVKVFNASTTNEFLANLSYLYSRNALGNEKAVDKTALDYPFSYPTTSSILPAVYANNYWSEDFDIPAQYDTGRYAYFIHKVQPSASDNFTKVFKTQTIKAGASYYGVWDKEASFGQSNGPNGTIEYQPSWSGPSGAFTKDPVVNFMTDLTESFSTQSVTSPDLTGYTLGFYVEDDWKVNHRLTLNLGLRLTHDAPYTDATGVFGIPAWTLSWYNKDIASGITSLPGMRWHGMDPVGGGLHTDTDVPLAGHTVNTFFYAPRFGAAYDLFGTGKTVVRGGFGVYYYRDGTGGSAGTSEPMGGTSCSTSGSLSTSFLDQITGASITCAGSTNGATSGSANDPNDHVEPRTLTYNFTISQQTFAKTSLEISYMGSKTSDLINPITGSLDSEVAIGTYMKADPNPASKYYGQILPLHATNGSDSSATVDNQTQDYLPYPNYTSLDLINHGSWANYNALIVAWNKRQGHLTYNLNYAFSKTLGVIGNGIDPINIHNDYGVLSSDRTHVINTSYAYEVGQRFKKNKLVGAVLNGWMVSGITSLQSGAPIPASFSENLGLEGNNDTTDLKSTDGKTDFGTNTISNKNYLGTPYYTLFPVLTCNPGKGLKSGQYVNPNCFSLPAAPTFDTTEGGANEGVLTALGGNGHMMPYFRGPAYFVSNLAASRRIKITESQSAEVRVEAENFLNHALKSFDSSNANNLNLNYTAGVLATSSTSGSPWTYGVPNEKFGRRVIEMTVRYNF
jgi:hypothetical protein